MLINRWKMSVICSKKSDGKHSQQLFIKMWFQCVYGKMEDMEHIYICEKLNGQKQPILQYDKIFNGNLIEQIEVYRKFEQNLAKR